MKLCGKAILFYCQPQGIELGYIFFTCDINVSTLAFYLLTYRRDFRVSRLIADYLRLTKFDYR